MKRDRERDRDRGHNDRSIDRIGRGGKDDRIGRESGGYGGIGHYSGSREDDHWLSRDGRDMRDSRYVMITLDSNRKAQVYIIQTLVAFSRRNDQ